MLPVTLMLWCGWGSPAQGVGWPALELCWDEAKARRLLETRPHVVTSQSFMDPGAYKNDYQELSVEDCYDDIGWKVRFRAWNPHCTRTHAAEFVRSYIPGALCVDDDGRGCDDDDGNGDAALKRKTEEEIELILHRILGLTAWKPQVLVVVKMTCHRWECFTGTSRSHGDKECLLIQTAAGKKCQLFKNNTVEGDR